VKRTAALAPLALALALAAAAWAAGPAVPFGEQQQVKATLGMMNADDLAYVPGFLPAHYEVSRNQMTYNQLTVTFTDTTFKDGSKKSLRSAINFSAQPYPGKLGNCGKGSTGSVQSAGKTVYLKVGNVVWRCVRAPSGAAVVVFANSDVLTYAQLAKVVATAFHVS
jgi:hypothetical protein